MTFDLPTLHLAAAFGGFTLTLLLLIAFLQNRDVPELGWWSLAFLLLTVGIGLSAFREVLPAMVITLGSNSLILAGSWLQWNGIRRFCRQSPLVLASVAAVCLWAGLCFVPAFANDVSARISVASFLLAAPALFSGLSLVRNPEGQLPSYLTAAVLCFVHTATLLIRGALPWFGVVTMDPTHALPVGWRTLVESEGALFAVAMAMFTILFVRDRTELALREAATRDPLTGCFNRRAFHELAIPSYRRSLAQGRSVAVLYFDLDHFKSINDAHGHAVGDAILIAFCRIAEEHLRVSDVFARVGGEEFVAFLPGSDRIAARRVAERIRAAFASSSVEGRGGLPIGTTVSIGIASETDARVNLVDLVARADFALFRAKDGGRDVVIEEGVRDRAA